MLAPNALKAVPAENYDGLKRQFFALKKLCESKMEQCLFYSKQLAEYDRESLIAGNEALESEREMNAQLTEELEAANERVRELEDRCSSHEKDMFRQCVFMEKTAEKLEQHREWQATASVLRRPTREARKAVNKFAIETRANALQSLLNKKCPVSGYVIRDKESREIIAEELEQLRKEQE